MPRAAEIAQPLQSINDIEKSRLPSHRIISDPSVTMESERQRIGEVLRSIQLTASDNRLNRLTKLHLNEQKIQIHWAIRSASFGSSSPCSSPAISCDPNSLPAKQDQGGLSMI
jgi:hypothetical protein